MSKLTDTNPRLPLTPYRTHECGALSFGGLDGNGVSFTSGSGVLLTQSASAVPEPGSWILMAAGVGLIGLARLRKPRTGRAV